MLTQKVPGKRAVIDMKDYIEINSQEEIDDLIYRYSGFYDSILKEVHMVNEAYIVSGKTYMPEQYDARLLFQSTFSPHGLELVAIGISELTLGDAVTIEDGVGQFMPNVHSVGGLIRLEMDLGFALEARRLLYRERTDWLDRNIFLDGEIPAPDAVLAFRIGGNWRQCSNCAKVWEDSNTVVYSRCPRCEKLLGLMSSGVRSAL